MAPIEGGGGGAVERAVLDEARVRAVRGGERDRVDGAPRTVCAVGAEDEPVGGGLAGGGAEMGAETLTERGCWSGGAAWAGMRSLGSMSSRSSNPSSWSYDFSSNNRSGGSTSVVSAAGGRGETRRPGGEPAARLRSSSAAATSATPSSGADGAVDAGAVAAEAAVPGVCSA